MQSLTLHDLVPVVEPTGKLYVHGIPSAPIKQAFSVKYDVHLDLKTHAVPFVVQKPSFMILAAQSGSVVAITSEHYFNLQADPVQKQALPSMSLFPSHENYFT